MLESVGPLGDVMRKLNQVREGGDTSQARFEIIEIIEALILALVAVATAWSGYQAAEWAGRRAESYAQASRLRVTAEGLATLAGQERIYDSDTFNSWLAAKLDSKKEAAEFFERRFRDEPTIKGVAVVDPLLACQGGKPFSSDSKPVRLSVVLCPFSGPLRCLKPAPGSGHGDQSEDQCLDNFNHFKTDLRCITASGHLVESSHYIT